MEVEINKVEGDDDDGRVNLPGFRFHPTDEELLGFYLKRKVEKRAIGIELIKTVDIYKHDPWDLPKSGNVGDKEWYFFCKRGRKYRNSLRPNRVTGSGFWKATGIDKPVYASGGEEYDDHNCIGLKKSLVYYRGCAGKGSKTDWMMHEFRLPPTGRDKSTKHIADTTKFAHVQEAEVWTLCRIFKRTVSYRKSCLPDWRELSALRGIPVNPISDAGSKTCSMDSSHHLNSYGTTFNPTTISSHANDRQAFHCQHLGSPELITSQASSSAANSSFPNGDMNELLRQAEYWEDDLRSILNCVVGGTIGNPFYEL